MNNGNFDFNAFIKESKDALTRPDYFATLKLTGGMTEPLIKAVIYGLVAGFFYFLWSVLDLAFIGGLFSSSGIMIIFLTAVEAVMGLFVLTVLMLILSSICAGSTDFEASLRVSAALMAIMPVSAFLKVASGINFYLGIVVTIAVGLYALLLTYRALVQALKAKPDTSRIAVIVLGVVFILSTVFF